MKIFSYKIQTKIHKACQAALLALCFHGARLTLKFLVCAERFPDASSSSRGELRLVAR